MRPARLLIALVVAGITSRDGLAQLPPLPVASAAFGPPHVFIENRGQWSNGSAFQMRRGNSVVAVRPDGFTIQMLRIDHGDRADREWDDREAPATVSGWNLGLTFRGASRDAVVQGVGELPGIYNYLRGSDPAGWVTKVHGYARMHVAGIYPGIDLDLYEHNGLLEYDLVLQPGADPTCIRLEVLGAESGQPDAAGRLLLHTPWQDVVQSHLACIVDDGDSEISPQVSASCRCASPTVFVFDVDGWDRRHPLTIDPTVVYSTCLGGSATEEPDGIAALSGQAVVGGATLSLDFPVSPGAFQSMSKENQDAYVTSFTPQGDAIVYSTYLGGASGDSVYDVTIGPDGLAIVAGSAGSSSTFPVTAGAYDVSASGESDGFVAKLTADGSGLLFCTLLGGSDIDPVTHVRVAPDGSIYVTGLTQSRDFPTTVGAFATSLLADVAAYVARFSPDGCQLLESTLLGGTGRTKGRGLGVDAAGNVYITGYASGNPGTPIPVTPGAFDTVANGEVDVFAAKFTPDLSSLTYCTYLGGSHFDEAWSLAVGADGAAYITGITNSSNYPTTAGALDKVQSGAQDAFVTKLNPAGSSLVFSTFLPGSGSEDADDIAVGPDGSVFVAGDTTSQPSSFPVTPDGWDTTLGGGGDSYLVRLDPSGSTVTYGSFIGGTAALIDECRTMALDEHGDAFVAGEAFSSDFPTTPGAFDPTMTDFKDSFVVRFSFGPWTVLGGSLKGTGGVAPWLSAWGTLEPSSPGEVSLLNAAPNAPATLVLGLSQLDAPFKGGTMVPVPLALLPIATDGAGELQLPWASWPAGFPSDTQFLVQAWVTDSGGPKGYAASQTLEATTP